MKVLYDHTAFYMQRYGGVSRYFAEIINILNDKNLIQPVFSDFVADNIHKYEISALISQKSSFSEFLNFYFKHKIFGSPKVATMFNTYKAKMSLYNSDFDIFHPTYYDPYFFLYLKGKPYVLTVHDMVHEKLSDSFNTGNPTANRKKFLIENAKRIIAISQNTKNDIVSILHINPDKIDVVYHGINFGNYMIGNSSLGSLPKRFVLYVGERKGYKNFTRFVNAFAMLLKETPDIKMVCTGKAFNKEELLFFKELNLSLSVIHYFAKDNCELADLYMNAQLFIYPSLYEGFGIPILEAFSCNCPVALSDASCFPEIGGDAAVYFNPLSEVSMFESMKSILTNENLSKQLIKAGKSRLKNFSWEKSADQTFEVYNKVLNSN